MIRKNKKCIECGREDLPRFTKKRCIYCSKKSYTSKKPSYTKKVNEELDNYFENKILLANKNPYSFESGKKLYNVSRKNICHLLPKRTYKSVSTHTDNFVLLTYDEHTRFDDLLDKFRFKDLTDEFPRTFNKLLNFVKDNEKIILENKKLKLEIINYLTEYKQ